MRYEKPHLIMQAILVADSLMHQAGKSSVSIVAIYLTSKTAIRPHVNIEVLQTKESSVSASRANWIF
jgi:hypothetical protein